MKKTKLEKVLLIFIMILPILDISSFLFRNYFNTKISISTFIRPIIPIIVMAIIFFKYKFKLKSISVALIYGVYAAIHIYIFNKLKTDISYGSITHEMQYLVNYTFSILNLFIILFVFYNKNTDNIAKAILIANGIYILSIYISIFTGTSSSTYLEGIGQKGWFESGNSISAILILNLFIILTLKYKRENIKIKIAALIEIISAGIFLTSILGTRTGLYGFILVIGFYIFTKLFVNIRDKFIKKEVKSKKNKVLLIIASIFIIAIIILVIIKGNSILERRRYLKSIENNIIDSTTGEAAHITGDVLKFKEEIEAGNVEEGYISKPAQQSIISLYKYANEHQISNTNRRIQQIIYNSYLVKNQSNIIYIVFGNGFLTNYGELVLEMEIPAFLFNFGLIGFILYFIPFFALFIYFAYIAIKNIKTIDEEYVMLLLGITMSFALSFLLGQIFFNSSAMIIITVMNVILYNKALKMKSNKISNKKIKEKEPALL